TYQKLHGENKYMLTPLETKVNDVNGNEIHNYGSISIVIHFNGISYAQTVIVCEVSQDGILGQDFLLNYVNKINYKQFLLHTDKIDIRCWIGGKVHVISRKHVRKTTTVPANSALWLPVSIPGSEHMTKFGYVEPIFHNEIKCTMVPGVIDTQTKEMVINIVNCSYADVTLQENLPIGVCEPYEDVSNSERVASINTKKENVSE
ncbi:hypothetical protein ACJMK2_003039, partial [Sinanodonta woodiana]